MAKRRQSFSIPRVWQYIGLGVLSVVVLGMVWSAFQPVEVPASAGSRPVLSAEDFASPVPEVTSALFIGDSYTHGTGASSEDARWTTVVATSLGWNEVNQGLGGTGYVTTSTINGCGKDYCPAYAENLATAPLAVEPAVVVIAGGQNDFGAWRADPASLTPAIATTFTTARDLYPDAQIIAVGPSTLGEVNQLVIDFDAAVQAAAATVGAQYVSLINPDVIDSVTMGAGDGGHVNDAGHQAIAAAVLAAVG